MNTHVADYLDIGSRGGVRGMLLSPVPDVRIEIRNIPTTRDFILGSEYHPC